jgi:hypothetical protein
MLFEGRYNSAHRPVYLVLVESSQAHDNKGALARFVFARRPESDERRSRHPQGTRGFSGCRPLEIDGPNNMAKAIDQATVIHGGHIGWPGKCVTRR